VTGLDRRRPATDVLLHLIPLMDFDGNLSDQLTNWILPDAGFTGVSPRAMKMLVQMTVDEQNLAWAIFPPYGYRM